MATGCWADLNSELLVSIATPARNNLSLRDYTSLRGVCTAWRSALALPYPSLLSLAGGRASMFSLPLRRSFQLCTVAYSNLTLDESRKMGIRTRARVVSSGNGRFAVTIDHRVPFNAMNGHDHDLFWTERILLLSPCTGEEVKLHPPGRQGYDCVDKIVFSPNPNDGTVVVMSDQKMVSYVDTRTRDDMKWTAIEVVPGVDENLVDLVFDDARGSKVYCLDSKGVVHVLSIPAGGRSNQEPAVKPSLTLLSSPVVARPYNIASPKNLFFCHGSLYQLWQNRSITVTSGNGSTMFADEIFLLRYNPRPWSPNWDEVKDLGGCSVFVGTNNSPAVARPSAVPGVQADCVYWIDWRGVPMVCDVATRSSKPRVLPYGTHTGNCWYFEVDNMKSIEPSTTTGKIKRRVYKWRLWKENRSNLESAANTTSEIRPRRVESYKSMDYGCKVMGKI